MATCSSRRRASSSWWKRSDVHALEVIATSSPNGPGVGTRFDVKSRFAVGRTSDNDLVLNVASLGSRHCRFIVEGRRLRVEHVGKINDKTFVNGHHVVAADLKPGDVIE